MANQSILLTVVPRALSVVSDTLPVSVVVSPRLTGAPTLDAFPDWLTWTERLRDSGLDFTIAANGHAIDASIDIAPLRPDLWAALFADDTQVDEYVFPDYSDRTVISYGVRDAMLAVKAIYQQATTELGLPADPRDRESVPRRAGILTSLLAGLQLDEWSDIHRQRLRTALGQRVDQQRTPRNARPAAPVGADGLPSAAHFFGLGDDLQLLKQQVGSEFALYSRMPPGAPIVKPDMDTLLDFHKVIGALNAYPVLLRTLGLVFDLDLPARGVPLTTGGAYGRLEVTSARPGWEEFAVATDLRASAATAYQFLRAEDGRTYWFTSPGPSTRRGLVIGLLDLDPDAFCLAQFDVDGAMHKLMMLAAGVPPSGSKLSPALHPTKFDDANTLPSLRSGGISIVQDERAHALLESIAASKGFNDRLSGNAVNDDPFFAEDLVRGYRIDVWDGFDATWRSLHRRSGTYTFDEVVFTTAEEEGYTQLAAAQPAPDPAAAAKNTDLYLHEAVARWNGWSLSVPPPGKAISRNPDPDRAVPPDDPEDRDPDDRQNEPVTPFHLKTTFSVAPRSLPSLRFGRRYRIRARVVDVAGNSLAPDDPLATEMSAAFAIPRAEEGFAYLRYEPVPAPQMVRRDDEAITGEGSALDRLVIRTFNTDPSLDGTAPEVSGSDRHIVPPRTSVEMAERHGMLDDLSGRLKGDAATYRMLVERDDEVASQFPRAPVPGQMEDLPLVAGATIDALPYIPDPLARYAALRDLPGVPEHAFGTATAGTLSYIKLSDPNPRPGSVTQIDFENAPNWLATRAFRLALAEGTGAPAWDETKRLLTVFLPKGSTTIVPLSSAPAMDDLPLLGIWQWLREYLMDLAGPEQIRFRNDGSQEPLATLLQRMVEGGLWMLTPPTLLTLVSAVQQPLGRPQFEALAVQRANPNTHLQSIPLRTRVRFVGGTLYDPTSEQLEAVTAWRSPGALDAYLIGALRVHGQTTAKVDIFAEWEEWIDDPLRAEEPPVLEPRSGFVDALPLNDPAEDRVLLAAGGKRAVGIYDARQDLIGFTTGGDVFGRESALLPEGDAAPRHYLGDTKHRRITYRATATSRYREYFPPDLDYTRTSEPIAVNVPASARPPLVSVRYVVPTFGWERQSSTNLVRSVRYGGGLRVYLDRPWYRSGEGELLGVVLWQAGRATNAAREAWKLFVTQWGRDPIWQTEPAWPPMPGPEHLPLATVAEVDLRLEEAVPADDDGKPGLVSVAGHPVAFDATRKLWYCDITLDCPTYNPFVRLALARYQPDAIADAKLSQVVLTDFVQLTPDRATLVSADPYRPKELRLSVTGTAPAGPPPDAPGETPGRPTHVRLRVQHMATPALGEFGWTDADADVARVQVDETASDQPGTLLWQGRVIFAASPPSGAFRLLIEEREYVSADHVATSVVNGAQADGRRVAPGRVIYAEIVTLGGALTLTPTPQATSALPEEGVTAGGDQEPGEDVETLARVIVQLRDGIEIPYADGAEQAISALIGPVWDAAIAAFPFLSLDRLFRAVDPDDLDTVFNRAAADLGTPSPALQKFFGVVCPADVDAESVAAVLRAFPLVFERVYVEARPALPAVNFADDPLNVSQIYLEPAPKGFDVKFAWTQPGGDGLLVKVADVEHNWDLAHEDLAAASTEFVTDQNAIPANAFGDLRDHGTMSAGVMLMADNALGGVGIVPRAKLLVASLYREQPDGSVVQDAAHAINVASSRLEAGDVLLIELEENDFTPIETNAANFAAIAAATNRGITVIEPGGNGPGNGSLGRFFDLDTLLVPSTGSRALSRPEGFDSGAVIVAACQSGLAPGTVARSPTAYSPRGRRIDCFAYGEHVLSASGVQPLTIPMGPARRMEPNPFAGMPYSWGFAGTSSASALIAGVAVSVQGLAKAVLNRRLVPAELRQVLSDRSLNTPSAAPNTDRIGVMPDLRKITAFLHLMAARGPVISGTWATVRSGHELVYPGRRRVLDWVPASRTWNVWPYDSLAIAADPLPAPAIKSGTWSTIGSGHTLLYVGGDLILDYVPATGDYRLFAADWTQADFLPGPAKAKGTWSTIRDEVVNGIVQQHRLVYLGGDRVLDWVPQDRSFRVWRIDRLGTRPDPLLGIPVAQPGGTVREEPLAEGAFADPGMNANTQIVTISVNEILVWHADTGQFKIWFYDRTLLSPQAFTESPRGGTWLTIRLGHVLVWLGELGNGQLLDWEPVTGKYRLFPGVPTNA
jgi:Subtilase family